MVYFTSIYGTRYLGMLNTLLFSIHKNAPESGVIVLWQDIQADWFELIRQTYPNIQFIKTQFDLSNNQALVASKVLFWDYGAKQIKKMGYQKACFMDVDTVLIKNTDHFLDGEFDLAFSIKNEIWPLNTGVLLVDFKNPKSLSFFANWRKLTMNIINDPAEFLKTDSIDHCYGSADQMAFYKIIRYNSGVTKYRLGGMDFKGYTASLFNETTSTPITDDTHIIHYKGHWQGVLIHGKAFTKKRTLASSREMYLYYLSISFEALKNIEAETGIKLTLEQAGFKMPIYMNANHQINITIHRYTQLTDVAKKYLMLIPHAWYKLQNKL